MKAIEFQILKEKVIELISESIKQDLDMTESFNNSIVKSAFENLPKHKEVIRCCQGIIGFHKFCEEKNMSFNFSTNALHDIRECAFNYKEPWFSPRTARYAILS